MVYSSTVSEPQRDRILARRSRFVALALSASGIAACHKGDGATEQHDTVYLPPAEVDAAARAEVDAGPRDTGSVAVVNDGPSADAGISAATRERYEKLVGRVAAIKDRIVVLDGDVTKMTNFGTSNAAAWQSLVAQIQSVYESIGWLSVYCPKPRPETDAFLAHVEVERKALLVNADGLKKKTTTKLADKTTTGDARYDQLVDQFNNANPRPCLSIACDSW